jgi:hypothetical protein
MADGITPAPGPPINAVVGVPITDAIFATYTVTDPSGEPGDQWRAHINFGDGQGDGQLIPVEKGEVFEFIDTHTYQTPGTYTITVMIAVPGSHTPNDNIVTTEVTVAPPTTSPTPTPTPPPPNPRYKAAGLTIGTKAGRESDRSIALFSEPNTAARDFHAAINWGDQSMTEPGQVRPRGIGRYAVSGAHRYLQAGKYQVTVTIVDGTGREIVAHSSVFVRK